MSKTETCFYCLHTENNKDRKNLVTLHTMSLSFDCASRQTIFNHKRRPMNSGKEL